MQYFQAMDKLVELFSSRKFVIALVAVLIIVVLAVAGRIAGDQALDFIKWVVGAWIAGQAATDVASKLKA